jgi:predicted DNA-binding helix-hairpin-helix protein
MAFHPVSQTPFDDLPPTSKQREFRLYQASFLLRDYGWNFEDIPFETGGNLSLTRDPKEAWAAVNLQEKPVEINRASRADLLRVPGIGPKIADAIVAARRHTKLTDLSHLRTLGLREPERTARYILLNGRRPLQQLALF